MSLRRRKRNRTYVEAHNRTYSIFVKSSRIIIWAGAFNVIGLMVSVIQSSLGQAPIYYFSSNTIFWSKLGTSTTSQFGLCYAICSMIFRFFETASIDFNKFGEGVLNTTSLLILELVVAILFSALSVALSVFASQGRKYCLYGQTIFYLLDTLTIIILYFLGEPFEIIWLLIGVHAIILFFAILSIISYYQLFAIERAHKNGYNQTASNITNESIESVNNNGNDKK